MKLFERLSGTQGIEFNNLHRVVAKDDVAWKHTRYMLGWVTDATKRNADDDIKKKCYLFVDIDVRSHIYETTGEVIKNLHKELHKLSTDPVTQCAIINKSITNNRKWLFKLDIREINANIQKIQIAYQQEVAKDKENKKAIWDKFISEYWSDTMQQVLDKINTSSFISSLL